MENQIVVSSQSTVDSLEKSMAHVPLPSQIEVVDEATAAILRTKTYAEKVAIVESMNRTNRLFILAGIRAAHPDWNDAAVQAELVRRMTRGAD